MAARAQTGPGEVEACAGRIRGLYGGSDDALAAGPGVLHVTSVCRDEAGRCFTLRIGPHSPKSETDLFALNLARARCDAVVTTGRILREEPRLRHALPRELAAWRSHCGAPGAPLSVVLTGRDDLDLTHPLLAEAPRAVVVTGNVSAARLRARVAEAGCGDRVAIVARAEPGLRDTIALLQDDGISSICIEAGPSTTADLYREPVCVDELMLSVFLGALADDSVRGGESVSMSALARDFELAAESRRDEESGPWCFQRYVRISARS